MLTWNIWKLHCIQICRWFLFSVSISFLFFNAYGLWETELFIIQAVYALTVVLFEVPTGFLSDRYSRKASIAIWLGIAAIGFFVYAFGNWFRGFLFAEFLIGIWTCFVSGSDTSLLYDTLEQTGKDATFKKSSWLLAGFGRWSEAIWGLIGWFVWMYSLTVPFVLDGVFVFFAFLISLTLVEPKIHRVHEWSSLQQLTWILHYVLQHRKILLLVLFSWFIGTITLSMVWFSQPFLQMNQVPVVYFWIYRAVSNLIAWFFSVYAHRIEQYLWWRKFMLLLIGISFVSILSLWLYPVLYMLPVFLIFQFVRWGARVVVQDELHVQTDATMRATIQSVNSMFFRLCFAIFWPIAWYLADWYGFGVGLIVMWSVLCVACYFVYRRYYTDL